MRLLDRLRNSILALLVFFLGAVAAIGFVEALTRPLRHK